MHLSTLFGKKAIRKRKDLHYKLQIQMTMSQNMKTPQNENEPRHESSIL